MSETPETPEIPDRQFDELGHELDESGQPVHRDIDPVFPTGFCRYCN